MRFFSLDAQRQAELTHSYNRPAQLESHAMLCLALGGTTTSRSP